MLVFLIITSFPQTPYPDNDTAFCRIWIYHNMGICIYIPRHCFPTFALWDFTHPMIWEYYGFLLHVKYVKKTLNLVGIFVFFHTFSLLWGIHFSHVFGIVGNYGFLWHIKYLTCKKAMSLKYFFPHNFPVGNSLFPWFENGMDFCFTENIKETHNFGMFFIFALTSPVLLEFSILLF